MAGITLSAVSRTQGNNRAVKDGTVAPAGFRLDFTEVPVLVHAFRRMVRELEFDVCEMAFTTYLCAKAHGAAFTALPIFLVRGFHHGTIMRNVHGEVRSPADLEGRTVGVNRGYTVTTGVWARAILHDEYGVDPNRVRWAPSGDEHVATYRPPPNVTPLPKGTDLAASVASGQLPASVGAVIEHPDVAPLVPDAEQAGFDALRDRGLYPINHLVVVRDELLAAYPNLAQALFDAFTESKLRYLEQLRAGPLDPTDQMYAQVMRITGADPLPYGIEPNRAMVELLIRHAVHQKIIPTAPPIDELFAKTTL